MKSESKENPSTETSDEVSGLNDYIFNDFQNPRKLSKRMHLLQNKFYSRVSTQVEDELESSKRKSKLKMT